MNEVFHTVRFTNFYTEDEIEARWKSLLFDPLISSTSLNAISKLPSAVKAQLDRQVPFSSYEDDVLAHVSFLDVFPDQVSRSITLEELRDSVFSKFLRDHPFVFYSGRDELDLFRQWNRLRSCGLIKLGSNKIDPLNRIDPVAMTNNQQSVDQSLKTCIQRLNDIRDGNSQLNAQLGGDPSSFSDTELLLEETVDSSLVAGIEKLTEPSVSARRHHMLTQPSYHGFQAMITDTVLNTLLEEESACHNVASDSAASDSLPCHVTSHARHPHLHLTSKDRLRPHLLNTEEHIKPCADFKQQRRLELYRQRRRLWARLRRRAEEAKRWTGLVEICATKGLELTDNQPIYPSLAALSGNRSRFLIKEKEVLFGRSSLPFKPHIDLSREGDATRVSRCHGRIRLATDGSFKLANFSGHAVFVDGHPVLKDEEVELRDLATVTIAHMSFRFDVNNLYVSGLCHTSSSNMCPTSDPQLSNAPSPFDPSPSSVSELST